MKTTKEQDYEVDNATGVNHEGPRANAPVRRLTASSIIGDKVENPQGQNLGKIDNLMVNLHDGRVEYAVVEMGSFLGLGGKLFAIPFTELQVDPVKEVFILNRSKEYLEKIPGFDKSHWPDTNAHTYFNDVNTYWGTANPTANPTTSTPY
jgi:sporulation protein YlmC with PRC-barrel domain